VERIRAAARRTIGLRENQADLVPGIEQAQERPLSKSRCAGKCEAQVESRSGRLAQQLGELGSNALLL